MPDDVLDTSDAPDDGLARRRLLARLDEVLAGDPEIEALYQAITNGNEKRDDIARSLDWSVDRVSVVRKKMNRRLAAAGLMSGDES